MRFTTALLCFLVFLLPFWGVAQKADSLPPYQKLEFHRTQLYIPGGLMLGGIATHFGKRTSIENQIVVERNEHLFGFTNHLDDYLLFAPFAAVYGFELGGMQPRTDWKNRTAIMIKGQIVNLGMVYVLKKTLGGRRPDGTAYSFPSGHTANAFAGATLLSTEFGKDYKWVPYASYTLASGIGIMRMVNNKHYISDVLFGAGLGIISMKLAYWTHQYRWNLKKSEKDPLDEIYSIPY